MEVVLQSLSDWCGRWWWAWTSIFYSAPVLLLGPMFDKKMYNLVVYSIIWPWAKMQVMCVLHFHSLPYRDHWINRRSGFLSNSRKQISTRFGYWIGFCDGYSDSTLHIKFHTVQFYLRPKCEPAMDTNWMKHRTQFQLHCLMPHSVNVSGWFAMQSILYLFFLFFFPPDNTHCLQTTGLWIESQQIYPLTHCTRDHKAPEVLDCTKHSLKQILHHTHTHTHWKCMHWSKQVYVCICVT